MYLYTARCQTKSFRASSDTASRQTVPLSSPEAIVISLQNTRMPFLSWVVLLLFMFTSDAFAECKEAKVKSLAEKGKTIAQIAQTCDMSKSEVTSMLKSDEADEEIDDPDEPPSKGLVMGTALSACACWGPADPRHRQPAPQCQSGYARPKMCSGMCYGGGYQWRGVCT